jgi:transposase
MATACPKNRYFHRARLSERKFRELLRCFSTDVNASDSARLTGISVRSVNSLYLKIRRRMAADSERLSVFNELPDDSGGIVATSRVGALPAERPLLFGIHRRNDDVYTELVPECASSILHDVLRGRLQLCDVFDPQDWVSRYDALADLSSGLYLRLQWTGSQFPSNTVSINRCEVFWGFARRRLAQFRGLHRHTFDLHLMETEYRFNHPRDQLYPSLLAMLRERPL